MKPFVPCEKCNPKGTYPNRSLSNPGFIYIDKEAHNTLVECKCHKAWREREALRLACKKAKLWGGDACLDYDAEKQYLGKESKYNIKVLSNFLKKKDLGIILYLQGQERTQKTTVANWLGKTMVQQGLTVQYMYLDALIEKLTPSDYSMEAEAKALREKEKAKLYTLDFLIIDDAFIRASPIYKNDFRIPYLYSFFKERVEHSSKPIILVSETLPGEIDTEKYGIGLRDFICNNIYYNSSLLLFKDNCSKLQAEPVSLIVKNLEAQEEKDSI